MASLLGIPIPMNSVGRLPIELLAYDTPEKKLWITESLFSNAKQVYEQVKTKSSNFNYLPKLTF